MDVPFRRLVTCFCVVVVVLANWAPTHAQQDKPQGYGGNNQGFSAPFDQGITDLDAYWSEVFAKAGVMYRSPQVSRFESPINTPCGVRYPLAGPFYCPLNETIYLSFAFLQEIGMDQSGNYTFITIAAHEWGHHIQNLLSVEPAADNRFELQADCLGGAFTQYASTLDRLDPGDVADAAELSMRVGDDPRQPENQPGAHGINDDRITAFMNGYINGLAACGLPGPVGQIGAGAVLAPPTFTPVPPTFVVPPTRPAANSVPATNTRSPLSLQTLIPATLSLSPGQSFRLYDQGAASFDGVVANSPDPAVATRQLTDWGWQENYYRVFAADNPPRNAAGWVELSVDRFSSVDGAAQALPAYADARRASHGLQAIDLGLFSDQSEAMSGPAYNGNEVSILARRGDLVIRATGITPRGDPTADVTEAMLKMLVPLVDEPRVVSSALFAALPTDADMPAGLRMTEEHARSGSTIASTFPNSAEAERFFQQWGWRENAARFFTGRSTAGTTRIEVSIFRFADPNAAAQALDYFLRGRAAGTALTEVPAPAGPSGTRGLAGPIPGGQEATDYFSQGAELFRVTAIGSGDPMRDLADVLRSWP